MSSVDNDSSGGMHVFYFVTDETNVEPSNQSRFFIYGGLILSSDQMVTLHDAIAGIRRRYNFAPTDVLKFDTNSRPEHVSREDHKSAKNDVITACHDAGVKFIAYMIHHNIARPQHKGEYALNSVLMAFNGLFLAEQDSYGIVVIDRLPDEAAGYALLKREFQEGLVIGDSGYAVTLDRVVMYATTCNGASHISSAVDIVLGGLRWVVNSQARPGPADTARAIFRNVAQMMYYHQAKNGRLLLRERGLILRPKEIKVPAYQADYDELVAYFGELLQD